MELPPEVPAEQVSWKDIKPEGKYVQIRKTFYEQQMKKKQEARDKFKKEQEEKREMWKKNKASKAISKNEVKDVPKTAQEKNQEYIEKVYQTLDEQKNKIFKEAFMLMK